MRKLGIPSSEAHITGREPLGCQLSNISSPPLIEAQRKPSGAEPWVLEVGIIRIDWNSECWGGSWWGTEFVCYGRRWSKFVIGSQIPKFLLFFFHKRKTLKVMKAASFVYFWRCFIITNPQIRRIHGCLFQKAFPGYSSSYSLSESRRWSDYPS